jgi:hypothetical protein
MVSRGSFRGGKGDRDVKPTTHFHPLPRTRMRGAIAPVPQYAFMAWCTVKIQGQLYLYLHFYCRKITDEFIQNFMSTMHTSSLTSVADIH